MTTGAVEREVRKRVAFDSRLGSAFLHGPSYPAIRREALPHQTRTVVETLAASGQISGTVSRREPLSANFAGTA